MPNKNIYICCLLLGAVLLAGGCGAGAEQTPPPTAASPTTASPMAASSTNAWAGIKQAVAVVHATAGNKVSGKVQFSETAEGKVKVVADLEGLKPNQQHGFHIHQFGDCTATDGASAGGHYNPASSAHALPPTTPRHAGDLGNVQADASGKAHYETTIDVISIASGQHPILGRAVIVHEKTDSGAQPTGDAGGRLGCGVIGVANTGQ
jgi:superoxide dismutase, Cu-Zn family